MRRSLLSPSGRVRFGGCGKKHPRDPDLLPSAPSGLEAKSPSGASGGGYLSLAPHEVPSSSVADHVEMVTGDLAGDPRDMDGGCV